MTLHHPAHGARRDFKVATHLRHGDAQKSGDDDFAVSNRLLVSLHPSESFLPAFAPLGSLLGPRPSGKKSIHPSYVAGVSFDCQPDRRQGQVWILDQTGAAIAPA